MLNERDGGIGGVKLIVEECETGYDTKKGVECYDSVKGKQPCRHQPVFDRHHAAADSQGGGRQDSDSVDGLRSLRLGRRQPVSVDLQSTGHLLGRRLGIHAPRRRRRGRLRQAQGQEDRPRPSRRALRQGADPAACRRSRPTTASSSSSIPVPAPQMQNQTSLWLDVRRDRPDWIYLQGWGAMNPTAVKEAAKIGFPMNRLVGVWWSGNDDDARPAGPEAKGYSVARPQRGRLRLPGHSGHPQIRRRQGQEPGRVEGQGRREFLQPRRLELGSHRRSDPQRPADRPARSWSTARTCGAASRRSTSLRRA